MRSALLILVVLAVPLHAADFAEFLLTPGVEEIFAVLLLEGGEGYRETERAAFVTIDQAGRYRCAAWPVSNAYRRQTFKGVVPPFTVAIAHTHPRSSRQPSAADLALAQRLDLPVFVLTPRDIWVATPDGTAVAVVVNRPWGARVPEGASPCSAAPQQRSAAPQERAVLTSD